MLTSLLAIGSVLVCLLGFGASVAIFFSLRTRSTRYAEMYQQHLQKAAEAQQRIKELRNK